ncbi:MAG: PAS domain S-box protein [Bacteroidetes bacterium]|nr:PAS domain S-box protein [Bacteroidota bacterium]
MQKYLSKPFFKETIDASHSPIWILKADDITFYLINSVSEKELQYTEEELMGESISKVCPGFSKIELLTLANRKLKKEVVTKIRRRDGSEQTANLKISNLLIEDKYYFYINVELLVLSPNNSGTKELTGFFYDQSFNTNLVPIIVADKDSLKILRVNDSVIRLYGYSRDELQHMEITKLHHPSDIEYAMKIYKSIKENRYNRFEVKHLSNNSRMIEVEIFIQLLKTFEGNLMVIIIHDISEKKMALRVLEENLNNYKIIAYNSTDIIIRHNTKGTIEYVSPASLKLLGYSPGYMTLNNLFDFIHPEDIEKIKNSLLNLSDSKKINLRIRFKNSDGKYLWFEYSAKAIIDPNLDSEMEIICNCRNITDKIEIEDKLLKAEEKAGEIEKLKNIILTNISHEMRTPLQSIIGYSQLIKDKNNDSWFLEEVNGIHENGQRLLRLINLLLNLTYLEANNFLPHFEIYNLSEIIKNVVEPFIDKAEGKGINIKINIKENPILIKTDKILLKDILDNIIDNSIKFTQHGTIQISTSVKLDRFYSRVEVTIEDNGIGFPPDKEEFVFEEFRQVSEGLSRNYEGIGLGLYLSKKMAEKINCILDVTSNEGMGTKVKLYLPIEA